ncbi:MAG TPA: glycoside hydrolase family 15 protein [Polyangiales bacterium]
MELTERIHGAKVRSGALEPFKAPLIEDHALIGNLRTAALVTRDGVIDWLCMPRFDADACFAALLGTEDHGYWRIAPRAKVRSTRRSYRGDSLILETEWTTDTGVVRVIDFMPIDDQLDAVVRSVECVRGQVTMHSQVKVRFGYGKVLPLSEARDGHTLIYAGPDVLQLENDLDQAPPPASCDFTVQEGDRVSFSLSHASAYEQRAHRVSAARAERETARFWREWTGKLVLPQQLTARTRALLMRSFITIKACTYQPTGAIVAAPTTSLPEGLGGERNWDYRFCWLRDASLSVLALMRAKNTEEAGALATWLRRAVAGDPGQLQIMYGLCGERRLTEITLDWLPGYERSAPVRLGNGAYTQYQLDIWGEVTASLYVGAKLDGMDPRRAQALLRIGEHVCENWQRLDRGIWEMRGPDRAFTASKVSAWSALERCIVAATEFEFDAPLERWRAVLQTMHDQICERGFDPKRNTFTQYYGSEELDASLLAIPIMGFLPPDDPRCVGTVDAVARELMQDGFVLRYRTRDGNDGLRGDEGAFLACSFWLVSAYQIIGKHAEAEALFERLIALCNDVGLLAEEYDPKHKRQVGNFPQAFSHLALIQAAFTLAEGTAFS